MDIINDFLNKYKIINNLLNILENNKIFKNDIIVKYLIDNNINIKII